MDKNNYPKALLPWTKYNHPQLGEVEIGGIDIKFTYQNPPQDYLLQEVEKATRFTLRMACTLSRLNITHKIKKIEDDLYQIDLTVHNLGYLPTYISDSLLQLQLDHSLSISIEGEMTLLSGDKMITIDKLEGYGCIPSTLGFYANISTLAYEPLKQTLSYALKAKPGSKITFDISSEKTGYQQHSIVL